jgi:hypothetical protein
MQGETEDFPDSAAKKQGPRPEPEEAPNWVEIAIDISIDDMLE